MYAPTGNSLNHSANLNIPTPPATSHDPFLFLPKLEILPADSTSAVAALVKRFGDPSGGVKLVAGRPQQTQKMISRSGKEGKEGSTAAAAQGAAARALAALPKGVRFSSPKMADSVRAANRRRLAASARAVANDRWAAQLGYQDGQEHIRDLK